MTAAREDDSGAGWRKLAALVLSMAVVGLPVNNLTDYALLAVLAVVIFSGEVSAQGRAWLIAAGIVAVAIGGQWLLAPPRIEEGHNVFLPGGPSGALQRGLPAEVHRHLANEFDAQYPKAQRCELNAPGCWQNGGVPDRAFAFSADGVLHKSYMSRSVTTVNFSDPVWLRLGFINEMAYNWSTAAPDVHRTDRDRRFWMGLKRWHLAMPWFEMIRLPAGMVGGEICWRGEVMWEGAGEHFALLPGDGCRTIAAADAGRRVVGIAIKPDTLAINLTLPWTARLLQVACWVLAAGAAFGLIVTLVTVQARRTILPFTLIGLAIVVIAIDDASFLGGLRPFDGGDDGLYYDGVGRLILQKLLSGDIFGALEGSEKVFYYGGPGLRYFRAVEHVVFGESYLGYLSLVLLLPFLAYRLYRRFLPDLWSIALVLLFVAIPVGMVFGTSFAHYVKWADRGFADPAAYILFIAGIIPIVGAKIDLNEKFAPAFFGALLLALGIFMKPIIAPAAAVLLGGAGLYALYRREWQRLAGLCIGFLPVFSMALHNWVYGHVFVLFSSNANLPVVLVMPPSTYVAAARELVSLDFGAGNLTRTFTQAADWLSGPAESYAAIPLSAAGIAVLIYVVICGRRFDPWLRLIGTAALAQHAVALFFNAAIARYHYLTWFLTMLVDMVWLYEIGIGWLKQRYPVLSERIAAHPWSLRLASGLSRLQKISA